MQGRGGGGLAIKATRSCLAASHRLARAQAAEGVLWPGFPVVSSLGSLAFPAGFRSLENPDFREQGEAPNLSLKHAAGASYLSIQCPRPKAKVLRVVGAGPR